MKPETKFIYLITLIAALGGLLFGYDTAVIAGAIGFLKTHFQLTAAMQGWAASSALIGCIFGAMIAGALGDWLGRKRTLIISAILFTISAIGSAIPHNLTQFVIARILGGVGVGAASLLSPLYIAEIAPAKIRGRLVSLNQLAIVSGMLIIYFVNAAIAGYGDDAWNAIVGWRWMFASETLPALLFMALLFFVPASPRWLTKQGREDEAFEILTKVNPFEKAKIELNEIKATIAQETGSLLQLFRPGLRVALAVGIVLAVLQQITGINAILYYAPEIFRKTGLGTNAALMQTVFVGAVNVTFTFVAIGLIDKIGRKALLLIGAGGMTIFLFLIGGAFYLQKFDGPWVLLFILLYIAAFAASLGPVVWVVISEIFPTKIRGRAMSIATVFLWTACYLVSQTFPMLLEKFGSAVTFWIYMIMSVINFLFVLKVVPETKGKTLEQIEKSWQRERSSVSI